MAQTTRLPYRLSSLTMALLGLGAVMPAARSAPELSAAPAAQSGAHADDLGVGSAAQWIRVAVAQDESQVDMAISGRFRIVSLKTADSLREGTRLSRVSVSMTPEGIRVGEQLLPLSGVRIEPARDATINLNGRYLRGKVEILQQKDLTLLVVNEVNLEDYLRGVISKEAPHHWPLEALKAIAIAARTYALFRRLTNTSSSYDVTSDVLSQLYGGKTAERRRTDRAIKDTQGLILVYRGRVFPSFYHSTCGGVTEHASVMGPFELESLGGGISCSFCMGSPFYRWQRRLTRADIAWALMKKGYGSLGGVDEVRVTQYTPTGRAARLHISGPARGVFLTGHDFRTLLGFDHVRSTAFVAIRDADAFILQGRGWGHGVGLCQWGSAELARRGLSAQEILAVYYPKADIVRLGSSVVQPILVQGGS